MREGLLQKTHPHDQAWNNVGFDKQHINTCDTYDLNDDVPDLSVVDFELDLDKRKYLADFYQSLFTLKGTFDL